MGQEAPTDPALHADFAVIAASSQSKSPFEHADAALDARPPAVGSSKRGALSKLLLSRGLWSLTWQSPPDEH
jgi:hypothetical protein